jgi:hypothetical protein
MILCRYSQQVQKKFDYKFNNITFRIKFKLAVIIINLLVLLKGPTKFIVYTETHASQNNRCGHKFKWFQIVMIYLI